MPMCREGFVGAQHAAPLQIQSHARTRCLYDWFVTRACLQEGRAESTLRFFGFWFCLFFPGFGRFGLATPEFRISFGEIFVHITHFRIYDEDVGLARSDR